MPEEPVGRFPESPSSTFLSFWPKPCSIATLDARVMRNVAFGSKLCLLRLKWTCVHQEEANVATGEVIPATRPGAGVGAGSRRLHGFVFVFGALTTLAVSGDHKAGAGKETPSPPHLGQNHLPAGLTCSALDATGNRIPLPNTHLQRRPQKPNHSHVKHLSVFSHHTNSSQQTWGESKCVSS